DEGQQRGESLTEARPGNRRVGGSRREFEGGDVARFNERRLTQRSRPGPVPVPATTKRRGPLRDRGAFVRIRRRAMGCSPARAPGGACPRNDAGGLRLVPAGAPRGRRRTPPPPGARRRLPGGATCTPNRRRPPVRAVPAQVLRPSMGSARAGPASVLLRGFAPVAEEPIQRPL